MGSFGEKMKRERELRAISLDEIANSTKIGTRLLHALEDEEFCKLPGGIFNKGFVRAYAKYLGLDEEQAVADYLVAENDQERRRRGLPEPGDQRQEPSGPPQLIAIQGGSRPDNVYNIRASVEVVENPPDPAGGFLMAGVILVFVLGVGGFAYKYFSAHPATGNAAASTGSQRTVPQPVSQPAAVVAAPAPASLDTSTAQDLTASGAPTASGVPKDSSKIPSAAAPDSTVGAKPIESASQSLSVPAEMALELRADEDSWAQITADGKQLWSGVISKDSTRNFRASKQLVVKLGNAPGVQLSYNGKPLPRLTGDSKTRTLTFPADAPKPE